MRTTHRVMIAWIGLLLIVAGCWPVMAQDPTYLSLVMPSTTLSTGQEYEVTIQIENVPELWMADMEIAYDPQMIYIMGTLAGSPVQLGSFFTPNSSIEIRNSVQDGQLVYTASQLAPADVVRGSGVLGTFRIYPLAPGTTTITFRQAELLTAIFTGEGENRVGIGSNPVSFAPIMLEVTISGAVVEPPSEATPTPTPTATPDMFSQVVPTAEATLVNVTRVPGSDGTPTDQGLLPPPTPVFLTEPEAEEEDSLSSLLIPLLVVLAVLLAAGLVLVLVARRQSRRSR